jgi:hypothetical protein
MKVNPRIKGGPLRPLQRCWNPFFNGIIGQQSPTRTRVRVECNYKIGTGEVCIDMKERLRKAAEAVFPSARVVIDPFHVIADSNKRMDETKRIEQDVHRKRKVQIPKKIFLVGREKLTEERRQRVDTLLDKYPGLK